MDAVLSSASSSLTRLLVNTRPTAAPVRVAFVLHAMQVAGAEVLVREIIHRLPGCITPTICCLDGIGPIGEQLQAEGVPVVCLGRRTGVDLRTSWRLARVLRERQVEVVHAHQYSPFFYTAFARPLVPQRLRVIFTEHGRHFPDVVSWRRRWVNRHLLSRAADVVNAVCDFSVERLRDLDGFDRHIVTNVPNGIDPERYTLTREQSELRTELGLRPERRYVLNVARLHPVKDQTTLIRAFAVLAGRVPEVDLLIAGDGVLREPLTALVQQLGLTERVRFLGVRRDVPNLLHAADVFTLTSVSEAASITLLEAMAAGKPVVVTAVGGNPELVRADVDGLLVPSGNVAELAVACERLLAKPAWAAELGANGQQRVRSRFTMTQTIAAYRALYGQLAGRAV
jgi:glycosyltransferase involved in cell wall biosynthesis